MILALAFLTTATIADDDTEQLIQQGRQSLEVGQAEQAGLIFERILLGEPWRLGVWLDYALSLQKMGDNDSARAIYQSILRQNPPEHLVPWLTQQVQEGEVSGTGWQHVGALRMQAGHDSNLNRAPMTSNLSLTLPAGVLVDLPLSEGARAKAGAFQLMRFDWQAIRQGTGQGDWMLQTTVNARQTPGASAQDYLQSSIGLMHGWVGASAREYYAIVSAQDLQYGGKDVQRTFRAGLYQGRPWQTPEQKRCVLNTGAETESNAYPIAHELNGQYLGLAVDLGCNQRLDWQLMLRAGVDVANGQRPGGDQQRITLRGQLKGNLGAGQWLAQAEHTWLHDTQGYSALLDNNAGRNIEHRLFKLEYQYPLSAKLQALASAESVWQTSNLPLFTLRGRAGWLGLRALF